MVPAKVYKSHLITIFQCICICKSNKDSSLTNLRLQTPLEFYMPGAYGASEISKQPVESWRDLSISEGVIQSA